MSDPILIYAEPRNQMNPNYDAKGIPCMPIGLSSVLVGYESDVPSGGILVHLSFGVNLLRMTDIDDIKKEIEGHYQFSEDGDFSIDEFGLEWCTDYFRKKDVDVWEECFPDNLYNLLALELYFNHPVDKVDNPYCCGINLEHFLVFSLVERTFNEHITNQKKLTEFAREWIRDHADVLERSSDGETILWEVFRNEIIKIIRDSESEE